MRHLLAGNLLPRHVARGTIERQDRELVHPESARTTPSGTTPSTATGPIGRG